MNYDIEAIYGGHEIVVGRENVQAYLALSIDTLHQIEAKVVEMFDRLKPRYMKENDFAEMVAHEMGKTHNFQSFHCVHSVIEKLRLGMIDY